MNKIIYSVKDYYYWVLGATDDKVQATRSAVIYYLELQHGYKEGLEEYITNKDNMKQAYNELKKYIF